MQTDTEMNSDFFIQTHTGRQFHFDRPMEHDYSIEDIAQALSNNCRYTGHTKRFYSVAEHCWHASHLVPHRLALNALLHDASEVYLHDLPSPLKWWLREKQFLAFDQLTAQIDAGIQAHFGLIETAMDHETIKRWDRRLLVTEAYQLMPDLSVYLREDDEPRLSLAVGRWNPVEAKGKFLQRFFALTRDRLMH